MCWFIGYPEKEKRKGGQKKEDDLGSFSLGYLLDYEYPLLRKKREQE
jgi:hypothetical protein